MLPLIGACVPLSRWSRRPGYWLDDDCCRLWESLDQENMVVRWLCVVLGLELFVRAERSSEQASLASTIHYVHRMLLLHSYVS